MTTLNSNTIAGAQKEWHTPELKKLPIEATANSPSKTGVANADVQFGPKTADATGQFS